MTRCPEDAQAKGGRQIFGLRRLFGGGRDDRVQLTARINSKTQPLDRGDFYEDPLHDRLRDLDLGEVTGGGTQMVDAPCGIDYIEIHIAVPDLAEDRIAAIIAELAAIGVPKGSALFSDGEQHGPSFGTLEGLALYLDKVGLPDEVYESHDVNLLIAECERRMGEGYGLRGHWQSREETAIFFYGQSFDHMEQAIDGYRREMPLCEGSRVERIA